MTRGGWISIVAVVATAGCLRTPVHRCDGVEDCAGGACVVDVSAGDGLCAIDDAECPSGLRFAADTGAVAGTCVDGSGPEPDAAVGDGSITRDYDPCWAQPAMAVHDSCIADVCAADARCCNREWNATCIQLVDHLCDTNCGRIGAFAGDGFLTVGRWDGSQFANVWAAGSEVSGERVMSVAWGDYDNDLRPDLATCEDGMTATAAIRIWHNDGDTFSLVKSAVDGFLCFDIDWVDRDDDGDLDVMASGAYQVNFVLNDGGGLFADEADDLIVGHVRSTDWAQLDPGSRVDAVTGLYEGQLHVLANASPDFVELYASTDAPAHRWDSVQLGDVDEDGALDLLASGDHVIRVLRNTTATGFAPASPAYFELLAVPAQDTPASALLDIDLDGDLDLIALGIGGSSLLRAYRNDHVGGGSGFTATPLWTSGTRPFSDLADDGDLAIGDVDGDGISDLVACATPDYCRMWLGNGTGGFTAQWDPNGSIEVEDVALTGEWPP